MEGADRDRAVEGGQEVTDALRALIRMLAEQIVDEFDGARAPADDAPAPTEEPDDDPRRDLHALLDR